VKTLHVPFQYHPEPPGGTEVYVTTLVTHLRRLGEDARIAAQAKRNLCYEHEGIPVRLYAVDPSPTSEESWGEGDLVAAANFGAILDDERPDLVHLHAATAAAFLLPLREAKRRGIPVVYTWHHPATSCPRSTLLLWGREACDGFIDVGRCASCSLQSHGLPIPLAVLAARVPGPVGSSVARLRLPRDIATVLRTRHLTRLFRERFHAFAREVDRIVVLADWIIPVLSRNGVDLDKVVHCPQALPADERFTDLPAPPDPVTRPLRLLFLGRLDPSKGVDTIVDAFRMIPSAPISLDIYGAPVVASYVRKLCSSCAADSRIRIHPPVPPAQVPALLRHHHILVVPSLGMEMAPLVILESLAAGTPVLASNRGGTSEFVRNEVDGLIVLGSEPERYRYAIERLLLEPDLIPRLRAGIAPPRHFADVAADMLALYRELLSEARDGVGLTS
jgi:glycosyltransferase involved in cell wall biosynthesis